MEVIEKVNRTKTKSPLYEVVLRDLTEKIRSRHFSTGQKIPPEKDLCSLYNVSNITIKRAMKELTRQGLVIRRPKIGTVVADAQPAASIRRNRNKLRSLVFIAPFMNDELISQVVHGLSLKSMEHGAHTIVQSSLNDPAKEEKLLAALPEMEVDGAVIVPIDGKVNIEQFFALKLQHQFPFVLADRFFDGLDVPHVITDDIDAGCRLTNYLFDQGHRRIGFVGENFTTSSAQQRYEGYVRSLIDHQQAPDMSLVSVVFPYTTPEGQERNLQPELEGYRRLLTQPDRPTAVVAVNNYFAYNLIQVAGELGLRVPDDLSVIGVGGSRTAHRCNPALTYLQQDFEKIGTEAYEALRVYVENNTVRNSVVPAALVPGHSVRSNSK